MVQIDSIKYLVISVMDPHAGESEDVIFSRKIMDIENVGITFWLVRSHKATPDKVQELCKKAKSETADCYFVVVEPSSNRGASPTKTASAAKVYSKDGKNWLPLPKGLTPVTGYISPYGKGAYGIILDNLELVDDAVIDLWDYADFFDQDKPITIKIGESTICAIKKDMSKHSGKIKTHLRRVIAIGKLHDPYCVYLR